MRLLVHDYSGHPFQLQLSRWLATQGHPTLHLYSADVDTPRGAVERRKDDPPAFDVEAIATGERLPKYDLARRWWRERAYAERLVARVAVHGPDVVISTGPPSVQNALRKSVQRRGHAYICWLQDIYGVTVGRVLGQRFGFAGRLAAAAYSARERSLWRGCDGVVAITEGFKPALDAAGISPPRSVVIRNWAPLDEIRPVSRPTDWETRHGLVGRFIFLYAGTLGLKHDPAVLADLAQAFLNDDGVAVVVASQGIGRDFLEKEKNGRGLRNLVLIDFQPYEVLSQMLSSADVAIALLEPHAEAMSVPSKVLSYLASGTAILATMPSSNRACRVVEEADAGLIAPPGGSAAFLALAQQLRTAPAEIRRLSRNGRIYAEKAFDIDTIGARFLDAFENAGVIRSQSGRMHSGRMHSGDHNSGRG